MLGSELSQSFGLLGANALGQQRTYGLLPSVARPKSPLIKNAYIRRLRMSAAVKSNWPAGLLPRVSSVSSLPTNTMDF